ncbi:M23 family metallopeptidase [Desulfosporosinus fructosivorans]
MHCSNSGRKRRARIVSVSVALLIGLGISLVSVFPAYSQVARETPIICYSVVTLGSGADLRDLATHYNTTVAEIKKLNSTTPLHSGMTLTIQENTMSASREISRGNVTSWNWPVIGVTSSAYGRRNGEFHHGLDIAISSGSLIRAARAGKVTKTGWVGVYGLTVMLDHGDGVQTLYAHNSKILVKVGDFVSGGERISISGNTGNSTGPHLHFEIRHNGKTVDPELYLRKTEIISL